MDQGMDHQYFALAALQPPTSARLETKDFQMRPLEASETNVAFGAERGRMPELAQLGPGLARLSAWRRGWSLALPFLCISAYMLLAVAGNWPLAILATIAMSFVTYGSISHDLVHRNLGLRRRTNDTFLCLIELLAIRSGHAYQLAHLHHHARFPHDDDIEGAAARMSLPRTLLEGVLLQPRIYIWAIRRAGPRRRARIVAEGAACMSMILAAAVLLPLTLVPIVYVGLMIAGSWIIPLITSYIPHDVAAPDRLHQTRAFRGLVASTIAMGHLYHLEHHLYPAVPHHHWPVLAKRLDPYLEAAGIKPTKIWF